MGRKESKQTFYSNSGSYMSANFFYNLLNKLRKSGKMQGLLSHFIAKNFIK